MTLPQLYQTKQTDTSEQRALRISIQQRQYILTQQMDSSMFGVDLTHSVPFYNKIYIR